MKPDPQIPPRVERQQCASKFHQIDSSPAAAPTKRAASRLFRLIHPRPLDFPFSTAGISLEEEMNLDSVWASPYIFYSLDVEWRVHWAKVQSQFRPQRFPAVLGG